MNNVKKFTKEKRVLYVILIAFIAVILAKYGLNEGTKDYRIIDGDTIVLKGEKIRLKGIDAPEKKQNCLDLNGVEIECGKIAKEKLKKIIGANKVKCEVTGKYKRNLGYCYAGNINLNKEMVKRGYAYARYSKMFTNEEKEAKKWKKGFWYGKFTDPASWRRGRRAESAL